MLPLSLLLWLLCETGTYAAVGHRWLGLDWPQAGIAALGAILVSRAVIIGSTWLFAAFHASPAPRLGFWQGLQMVGEEFLAFVFTFVLLLPFERLWMAPDRLKACRHPVLLVHGYGCSRGAWWWLRRRLEKAGHTVATISLTPPYTSIGLFVPQLAKRIDEVCTASGAPQVILIAHSMGGLVSRAYLARHGSAQVAGLITLATPHAGTALARYGIGRNAREMETGSLWLRDLAREKITVPVVSLCTPHDNFVMPQDLQRLDAARNIPISGLGHLAMLYSPRVANLLLDLLAPASEP